MDQYVQTIMNLIRVETKVKSEWSSTLWKIKLVLNITIEKATGTIPLGLVISIDGATYRNIELDRNTVRESLLKQTLKEIIMRFKILY